MGAKISEIQSQARYQWALRHGPSLWVLPTPAVSLEQEPEVAVHPLGQPLPGTSLAEGGQGPSWTRSHTDPSRERSKMVPRPGRTARQATLQGCPSLPVLCSFTRVAPQARLGDPRLQLDDRQIGLSVDQARARGVDTAQRMPPSPFSPKGGRGHQGPRGPVMPDIPGVGGLAGGRVPIHSSGLGWMGMGCSWPPSTLLQLPSRWGTLDAHMATLAEPT